MNIRFDASVARHAEDVRALALACRGLLAPVVSAADVASAEIAAAEIATNFVRHAPDEGEFSVTISLDADRLELRFVDGARSPFDPRGVPEPHWDPTDRSTLPTSGFGIWLARAAVDDLAYDERTGTTILRRRIARHPRRDANRG